jgi:sugar/nucleoside kinase (ribokinase family)
MLNFVSLEPVDYLVIGHVAHDLTPEGWRLGGTVAYSALTAQALGMKVGIVTACGPETALDALQGVSVISLDSPRSTTFENIYTGHTRVQYLRARATRLDLNSVPASWRNASILHLGPIANEMDSALPDWISASSWLGVTPQGWMRVWDRDGRVARTEWKNSESVLQKARAVIFSREDVDGDDELVERMAHQTQILALTEAHDGCVLYWHGDRRRFRAPEVREVDATGAGDVFAAAFFVRMLKTRDPWESARFATLIASRSVTRVGLAGIPTPADVEECLMEVLQ